MSEWKNCRKKPMVVEFREPHADMRFKLSADVNDDKYTMGECVNTHEGKLFALQGIDYVIRGIQGELYPIKKDIFAKTYEVIEGE